MESMYYIGLDIHKKIIASCINVFLVLPFGSSENLLIEKVKSLQDGKSGIFTRPYPYYPLRVPVIFSSIVKDYRQDSLWRHKNGFGYYNLFVSFYEQHGGKHVYNQRKKAGTAQRARAA